MDTDSEVTPMATLQVCLATSVEHKLRVFQNRLLRIIFGTRKKEDYTKKKS
jgi:hypothetical protein